MIAIIHAKNGKYVDIATSSEVLAIRDSQKMKPLYESLGVTVSHNSERF
jgi:preprotein translocase subunit SecA